MATRTRRKEKKKLELFSELAHVSKELLPIELMTYNIILVVVFFFLIYVFITFFWLRFVRIQFI